MKLNSEHHYVNQNFHVGFLSKTITVYTARVYVRLCIVYYLFFVFSVILATQNGMPSLIMYMNLI